MERKLSKRRLSALQVDDVVPPFLAQKLELCRRLDEAEGSPCSPSRRRPPSVDPEEDNLRKKDAFLRSIFADNKLNHRQKEHIAANLLIGQRDTNSRPAVFNQSKRTISPSRTGNIVTDGHQQRHGHHHRSVELVGGSVEIKAASAKELRQKEVMRRHDKTLKTASYTWANDFIEGVAPYKISAQRSFEGVRPSPNREFIVDAISHHNSGKAKKNADQVRTLKATALQEKSMMGNDVQKEVSVKKKLKKFRKKLVLYLEKKGERQRGDIMRCIDEETIYTFMENFKGYSMSPDVILSLLGTSLGSAASEGVLLVPDTGTLAANARSGYLPVQSSYQELSPHLRELHIDTAPTEDSAHDHGFASGFVPHTIPNTSYSTRPSPPKPTNSAVNGFKVNPPPSSRMGSGFMVNKTADRRASLAERDTSSIGLAVEGAAVSSPTRGEKSGVNLGSTVGDQAAPQGDVIKISAGEDKSTWITELEQDVEVPSSLPISPPLITDSFHEDSADAAAALHLGNAMKTHMAVTETLPSLYPEKVLTDEELIGLGTKKMTFEEIAVKKERAALLAKRAKKPVTGLAGLKGPKAIKANPTPADRTPIPRFIRTPQSGGEDFFPKSPNPATVAIEHFSD